MKQTLFAILIGITCCTGCTDNTATTGSSDKQQTNLEAARKVAQAFETGDVSAIDSVVADDFVDHTDRGDKVGRDSLKAMVNMIRTNFKDMKMETIRELADDEYTFQWMHYTGKSDGSMMPAGPFDMHGMEITKFRDGKAIEHWAYMDIAEMMKMMGQPPPPMAGDTTKTKMDSTRK
jgi:predicted SnoaL-like aldol condensation-catalyzing enzyme